MTNEVEIAEKLWKALKSDRTVMLGLVGIEDGHSQPMTAQLDPQHELDGPIYFFTASDTDLIREMGAQHRAVAHFASKGHHLFASVHGRLTLDTDRATLDRLWNRFVAAWSEGGKDDPKLRLLRLEPERAQVWLNASSLFAGVKILMGSDPKKDYKDKVADINLDRRPH